MNRILLIKTFLFNFRPFFIYYWDISFDNMGRYFTKLILFWINWYFYWIFLCCFLFLLFFALYKLLWWLIIFDFISILVLWSWRDIFGNRFPLILNCQLIFILIKLLNCFQKWSISRNNLSRYSLALSIGRYWLRR